MIGLLVLVLGVAVGLVFGVAGGMAAFMTGLLVWSTATGLSLAAKLIERDHSGPMIPGGGPMIPGGGGTDSVIPESEWEEKWSVRGDHAVTLISVAEQDEGNVVVEKPLVIGPGEMVALRTQWKDDLWYLTEIARWTTGRPDMHREAG